MPPLKERKVAANIKLEIIHMVDGICLPQAVAVLQICGTKIFVGAYPDRLCFDLHRPRVSGEGPIAVPAALETAASSGPTVIFAVAACSQRRTRPENELFPPSHRRWELPQRSFKTDRISIAG
ncbi:hypothetical protein [Rhizobium esperanzae]|uniref:hypothetical protein n=1 Tax=Rhizobium esperanzae TaxID=1967781 RepID=UPI0011316B2B|nr:hypothetical protein [Rhizobium esperanzae]